MDFSLLLVVNFLKKLLPKQISMSQKWNDKNHFKYCIHLCTQQCF